ncbi:MAG: hypothetical protein V7K94_20740 [Nostoc sp.]
MVNRLEEDIHQLPMRSCAIGQNPNPREVAPDGVRILDFRF